MMYSLLFYAAVSTALMIPVVMMFVLSVVGMWKIFTKAGIAGWKSLIPVYNSYNLYKISWVPKFFWMFIAVSFVSGFFMNSDSTVMLLIYIVLGVVSAAIDLVMNMNLAKSFGRGKGFGVLLWIAPFIGTLILGFGKDTYLGNTAA